MIISKEVKIGAVFFLAITILVVFAVALGALPLGGGYKMTVYFDEVLGLEPGNDVWLYGKKIGSVSRFTHTRMTGPDGKQALMVKVVLNTDLEVTLYDDYAITVVDRSVIGGRAVEIKAGTPGSPAHRGVIYGSSRGNPLASMGEEFSKSLATMESVGRIAADLQGGKGTLGALLKSRELHDELLSAVRETRVMMETLNDPDSTFMSLLKDEELSGNIKDTAAEMKNAAEEFSAFIEKTNSPDSFLSKLATDEVLFEQFELLVANLTDFSERLRAGKGLSRILDDENLYNDIIEITVELRRTVKIARELIAEIQQDPQVLIVGRPTGRESWLVKQLRGEGPSPADRAARDARKLVPND